MSTKPTSRILSMSSVNLSSVLCTSAPDESDDPNTSKPNSEISREGVGHSDEGSVTLSIIASGAMLSLEHRPARRSSMFESSSPSFSGEADEENGESLSPAMNEPLPENPDDSDKLEKANGGTF